MSLTLPIWVIGVEPQDYEPIRQVYESAANLFIHAQAAEGRAVTSIAFDRRLIEEPVLTDEQPDASPGDV
jgi:hypothetical protein